MSSNASPEGAFLLSAPGPSVSVSPSQRAQARGVRIDQRMEAKRLTKKGAVAATM